MACDPKKIFTDLQVIGAVLTYAELWVSGNSKVLNTTNTDTSTTVYDFAYKGFPYYNTLTLVDGAFTEATIRTGSFDNDNPTAGTIIERREF